MHKKGQKLLKPKVQDKNSDMLMPLIPQPLKLLIEKRFGGSVNCRGIYFQILCAINIMLSRLPEDQNKTIIRLEGAEDIDVYIEQGGELIQVKTSQNSINANDIWNLQVLQHFWEVHQSTEMLTFTLIHNTRTADGNLNCFTTGILTDQSLQFWLAKFQKQFNNISREKLITFLSKVTIKSFDQEQINNDILQKLYNIFNINTGTEPAFFSALFYFVFDASANRATISDKDLQGLIQQVSDSFSKFPQNPALQNNWISKVQYEITEAQIDEGYYDGKAARPIDIALGIPVKRPAWEKSIIESLNKFDITIIRSSSGQGKSTLAWQVGLKMFTSNYSVYQLQYCPSYNEASAVEDFIISRIRIGQIPLIIIDGLSQKHAAWEDLAMKLRYLPAKLLITTRQEDWVKYQMPSSTGIINEIDIQLSFEEAGQIFAALKEHKRIHPSISNWQPIWEKVKDKGLMIEFVYLLTRGKMISERLSEQIQVLSKENGGAAKLEILRIISTADLLSIKLRTDSLTEYIRLTVGFQSDRNETFKQLEKEYYLKFDEQYVEGLHPVRSKHLHELLHSHIPIEDTIVNLLHIVNDDSIYDFFLNVPLMFPSIKQESFYKKAAVQIVTRSIPDMVYSIDGLMHSESFDYWVNNKIIFDEVRELNGLDLFAYDTCPFNTSMSLKKLSEGLQGVNQGNLKNIINKHDSLTSYSFENSGILKFTKHLKTELESRKSFINYKGIAFLYQWFKQLNINFPNIITITESFLLDTLNNKDISESAEIFKYYYLTNPSEHKLFSKKHKKTIIAAIKEKTNTLTIREDGNDIQMEYLLDPNIVKVSELSIYRINIVQSLLPYYEHYGTKAIILPFPNAEIYENVVQNSIKKIPSENLYEHFDVHLNQIWGKTIIRQYNATSHYEWQKKYFYFRSHCVQLYIKCTRLIENILEKGRSVSSLTREVSSLTSKFGELEVRLSTYPSSSKKYFDTEPYQVELSLIKKWLNNFRNFLFQFSWLINPSLGQNRNLPIINIRGATYHLTSMQENYDQISTSTYPYFDTTELKKEETKWLTRLLYTTQFYWTVQMGEYPSSVIVAAKEIQKWKESTTVKELVQLEEILKSAETTTGFKFYPPSHIMDTDLLRHAVIGIYGCDFANDDQFWDFSISLMALSSLKIDYYTIFTVNEDRETISGIRFYKTYFDQFTLAAKGIAVPTGDRFARPLFATPTSELLGPLPGIKIEKKVEFKDSTILYSMMFNIWKLTEYRSRLNAGVKREREWLSKLEQEFSGLILKNFENLEKIPAYTSIINKKFVDEIVDGRRLLNTNGICQIMRDTLNAVLEN